MAPSRAWAASPRIALADLVRLARADDTDHASPIEPASVASLLEAGARLDLLAWASLVVAALAALLPWLLSRADLADDEHPGLAAALATVLSLHAVASAAPARATAPRTPRLRPAEL